jgi:hypothetical protein
MFKGSIDEVQFWSRTLSPAEVATVADSGVSLNPAPSVPFTYSIENEEVTITGYTGTGGAVVIPATIGGLPDPDRKRSIQVQVDHYRDRPSRQCFEYWL